MSMCCAQPSLESMDLRVPAQRHANVAKSGTVWRQSTVLKGTNSQKSPHILNYYSKYTGTLSFENLCQSVEEELHCHHRAVAPFLVRTAFVCRGAMVQPAPPGGSGAEACHVYLLADAAVFRQVLE